MKCYPCLGLLNYCRFWATGYGCETARKQQQVQENIRRFKGTMEYIKTFKRLGANKSVNK